MRGRGREEADLGILLAQQLRRIELVFIELRRLPEEQLRRVPLIGQIRNSNIEIRNKLQ